MAQLRRVGLLGGTFDPVHTGHIRMAVRARDHFGLDQVIFMPAGRPPHKNGLVRTPDEDRLAMLAVATEDEPAFTVSRLEIDRRGLSYTALTLTQLTQENPDTVYYFILGADSLDYLDQWYRPDIICRLAIIAVADRPPFSREKQEEKAQEMRNRFGADVRFFPFEPCDVSSTQIREKCRRGEDLRGLVPQPVDDYIRRAGLYRY